MGIERIEPQIPAQGCGSPHLRAAPGEDPEHCQALQAADDHLALQHVPAVLAAHLPRDRARHLQATCDQSRAHRARQDAHHRGPASAWAAPRTRPWRKARNAIRFGRACAPSRYRRPRPRSRRPSRRQPRPRPGSRHPPKPGARPAKPGAAAVVSEAPAAPRGGSCGRTARHFREPGSRHGFLGRLGPEQGRRETQREAPARGARTSLWSPAVASPEHAARTARRQQWLESSTTPEADRSACRGFPRDHHHSQWLGPAEAGIGRAPASSASGTSASADGRSARATTGRRQATGRANPGRFAAKARRPKAGPVGDDDRRGREARRSAARCGQTSRRHRRPPRTIACANCTRAWSKQSGRPRMPRP